VPLRLPVATTLVLAAVLSLTAGCNATKRELVVMFSGASTAAQHLTARGNCTGVAAHTTPEPLAASTGRGNPDVRFRIDKASDKDIATLEACLQRQPGVSGFRDTNDET
jgi:hypothetical protein